MVKVLSASPSYKRLNLHRSHVSMKQLFLDIVILPVLSVYACAMQIRHIAVIDMPQDCQDGIRQGRMLKNKEAYHFAARSPGRRHKVFYSIFTDM